MDGIHAQVRAFAADELALDDGDLQAPVGEGARAVLAGRAAPDDNRIISTHARNAIVRAPAQGSDPQLLPVPTPPGDNSDTNASAATRYGPEAGRGRLESPMNKVEVEQKSYEMPPREGFTVAHFLTVSDIERSARFYETVFGGKS